MDSFCSDQVGKLAQALINVQRQLQPATKDANNPFTKSKYATLNSIMDSCREALLSNGIWLCQYPVPAEPGISGWSRNSPMPNLDNGSRALRWFLFPRQTPKEWASA